MQVSNEQMVTKRRFECPMGPVVVTANDEGILGVDVAQTSAFVASEGSEMGAHWAEMAVGQLQEYFQGTRTEFDLPLVQQGTTFQRAVWGALHHIPYGATQSYGDIAKAIGNERAVRAVGQANRANPFPIIIPCHRVIGTNGGLVGYAGSHVDIKSFLLELERSVTGAAVQSHA